MIPSRKSRILIRVKANWLFLGRKTMFFLPTSSCSSTIIFLSFLILRHFYFRTSTKSTPHRPYIEPSSTRHRPHIGPTSTPHRPHIDPTSTLLDPAYLNEIPPHFIHEIMTKGYEVICVNIFLRRKMRFSRKKG